ncbi:phosphotransferase [Amnibacterium sp.]|uniref:maltokinase N-terminal cap-like domain-containing protein n=1 Tax=Amnibacterium sp. TaxID=1872496 RepID=UPI00260C0062|nr:phosphotransferase [Amnibacterium sp.]MCU1474717.1 putative maltokinase [Amnibacterium sp.]
MGILEDAGRTVATPRLTAWIARQRWFANHAPDPHLTVLGSFALHVAGAEARTLLVQDHSPDARALYQVPLVSRPEDPDGIDLGDSVVVDGPRDRAWAAALVGLALGGGTAGEGGEVSALGERLGWLGPPPTVTGARVLSGEQSNTSVIVTTATPDGDPGPTVIVKVFRALHHGENPDVVLQSAIAGAGSGRVPATYGAVLGEWPDPGRADGRARGHLAVAQEFLADTEDAWRVALAAARGGVDFARPARDLGAATAEVHQVLAAALPTVPAGPEAKRALLAGMRARAEQAVRAVPSLAGSEDRIDAVLSAAEADDWPPFQRIHGDYHLGQVLSVPDRGWVLLDFEGEPLRPMAERSEADTPLRDVAGMLRSFDYVAGTLELEDADPSGRAWADTARDAFLEGYAGRLGEPLEPRARLLAALELDKALYECVYEVRNRPAWLPIPERAVHRLA